MNEILKKLSEKILDGNDIAKILGSPNDFPKDIVEKLSLKTANDYWNGKTDYENANCIMNNLHTFWVTNTNYFKNFDFGKIAWICYNAFDSGEYIRSGDDPEIDPAEKYTKPIIKKLLQELSDNKL